MTPAVMEGEEVIPEAQVVMAMAIKLSKLLSNPTNHLRVLLLLLQRHLHFQTKVSKKNLSTFARSQVLRIFLLFICNLPSVVYSF